MDRSITGVIAALALSAVLVGACSSPGSPASPTGASGSVGGARPSSPAVLRIVQPTDGATITGETVHVVVSLQGGKVVQETSAHIRPDEGHVHLYLDNQLVYMQYSLQQDLPVHPGTYVLKAEFVAADHAPFNPRVFSEPVVFTVH